MQQEVHSRAQAQQTSDTAVRPKAPARRRLPKWGGVIVALIVVVIVGVATVWGLNHLGGQTQTIAKDRYQVVFMQSGQVFFGKLQNTTGDYLTLTSAYYTQTQAQATSAEDAKAAANGQTQIVPVNKEIYSPDSSIALRADQVLFWQNLQSDSQVAKLIDGQSK